MAVTRTYVGEPDRYFPELGVTPTKGDEVTFDSVDQVPDDGRWKVPPKKRAAAKRAAKAKAKLTQPIAAGQNDTPTPDAAAAPAEHTEES